MKVLGWIVALLILAGIGSAFGGDKAPDPYTPEDVVNGHACTWEWKEGNAPVDVGWSNAVQVCR